MRALNGEEEEDEEEEEEEEELKNPRFKEEGLGDGVRALAEEEDETVEERENEVAAVAAIGDQKKMQGAEAQKGGGRKESSS